MLKCHGQILLRLFFNSILKLIIGILLGQIFYFFKIWQYPVTFNLMNFGLISFTPTFLKISPLKTFILKNFVATSYSLLPFPQMSCVSNAFGIFLTFYELKGFVINLFLQDLL